VVILFLIVFIGLVGFGIILPLFPFYAERFGASPEVITWTMAAFTLAQAVGTPIWGRISDAYGRRMVLILTMFGSALAYVMLAYADELWIVMLSRVFGGLMAGNISAAFAYVTDITTDENRSAGLGKVGAATGLGFIFGPAIGGLLAGAEVETANFVAPALASAGVSLVAMVGTIIFLPESLDPKNRKPLFGAGNGKDAESHGVSLAAMHRGALLKLLIATMLFFTAMSQMESIFPLWAHDLFRMGPRDIGAVFFVIGIVVATMQGAAIGPLTRRFGERPVAMAAGVFFAASLVILALASTEWQIWLGLVPFGLGVGLFNPTVSSMVSKTASANERGAVMGQFHAASAMGRFFGPAVSGLIYSKISMAAPFGLGALIMLPVIVLVGLFHLKQDNDGALDGVIGSRDD
jgi:DHA1 family tetracycline resistance protein-like MFS transporter